MKILSRYILNEVVEHAAIGIALFTFVIFLRDLGKLLEIVVRDSAPLASVLEVFLLTLPVAATITIPMGLLVGILLGLSRLAADSEVTAMRASGIGAWRFVAIVSIFSVGAWMVALFNTVWLAPHSAAELTRLEDKLRSSQASFEIQPRVFYEDFKNMVLYVEDVRSGSNASEWRGVFLADITNPSAPRITMAKRGLILAEGENALHMHLEDGSQQEVQQQHPEQYEISTFAQTDLPIAIPTPDEAKRDLVPVAEMSTRELWQRAHHPELDSRKPRNAQDTPAARARWYLVEFHRRFALPTSCLVLALVGVPLGLSSRKGGKSMGFVLTIALVFAYYLISLTGISLGRSGKVPPWVGVWAGNFVFFFAGGFLLNQLDHAGIELGTLRSFWEAARDTVRRRLRLAPRSEASAETSPNAAAKSVQPATAYELAKSPAARRKCWPYASRYPLILDEMILRDFLFYLGMILVSFLLLTLVFTFFELLGDIVRNHVSMFTVGQYLINVSPSFIYTLAPLSVMLAVLTTIGLLQRSNEITAMKATGTSIYRVTFPVVLIAAVLAGGLFFFDQLYIPQANQRQETLRNQIKGKPAQTYLRPDRKWIFGEHNTIYYYEFFDPDKNTFVNVTAFQFDPETFKLVSRVHAARARWSELAPHKWILENGWARDFHNSAVSQYRVFDIATFPFMSEPPSYFKKEVHQSSEMNVEQLRGYIADLEQSGFDVVKLRVQLQKKFAYPLITLVMAILAVPFSLSSGRKSALSGIVIAVATAIIYLVAAGLFEAMGNASYLPSALAAWSPDLLFGLLGGYLLLKVPT